MESCRSAANLSASVDMQYFPVQTPYAVEMVNRMTAHLARPAVTYLDGTYDAFARALNRHLAVGLSLLQLC